MPSPPHSPRGDTWQVGLHTPRVPCRRHQGRRRGIRRRGSSLHSLAGHPPSRPPPERLRSAMGPQAGDASPHNLPTINLPEARLALSRASVTLAHLRPPSPTFAHLRSHLPALKTRSPKQIGKWRGWVADEIEHRVDRLEMFETVLFSVQLTAALRLCTQVRPLTSPQPHRNLTAISPPSHRPLTAISPNPLITS